MNLGVAARRRLLNVRPSVIAAGIKRLLRIQNVEVSTAVGRFSVDPVSYFGDTLLSGLVHEQDAVTWMRGYLQPGSSFVDVGAGEGYFTVIASRCVGSTGRVVAVEPQDRMQPVIRENLKLNDCTNVSLLHCAAGRDEGESEIYLAPSLNVGATSAVLPTRYPLRRQRVTVLTLDSILDKSGLETCDLLKVDVEGFEAEVMESARLALADGRIRAALIEFHPRQLSMLGSSRADLEEFMFSQGFGAVAVNLGTTFGAYEFAEPVTHPK